MNTHLLLPLLLLSEACSAATEPLPSVEGTIEYLGIEGGCYVLRADKETLEIINLPERYRRQGLRLRVKYKAFDGATICMAGRPVEGLEFEEVGR